MKLNDIVKFRGDKLFNGAVNIDWYSTDKDKSRQAAEAFVFHGPAYHGISGDAYEFDPAHKLIDTASFTKAVVERAYGYEDAPFTLAIAGYGTGKSHLGVTLAELMGTADQVLASDILDNIQAADMQIAEDIKNMMNDVAKPCLVIALNGLNKFDFLQGLSRQIIQVLKRDGHDVKVIEDLRPRFQQAIKMAELFINAGKQEELSEICGDKSADNIIELLEQQDEATYKDVNVFFSKHDMQISSLQGESVKELIGKTVEVYCGENKPYQSLVILFDEFGKYMEFASTKSHLAGSGVLQDLFESIQNCSPYACFVGFIQFELNAYLQRMAFEHKNEMQRYITRYQTADKLYLSTNLETLIANLIEKKKPEYLDQLFDKRTAMRNSEYEREKINDWFPSSRHIQIWNDTEMFHHMISKGSWPLSSYSIWLLYYLTAVGSHLQERSALALLIGVFKQFESETIPKDQNWRIAAVDMMSNSFIQELLSAEESGAQGTIMQSYQTVISKYSTRYSTDQVRVLKAIVLSSKLGLVAKSKDDAIEALVALSNMDAAAVSRELQILLEEYNAIEWDEAYKAFDILGDALPRSQFINHIRRHLNTYDENSKSQLFVSLIKEHCNTINIVNSDFAEENNISTPEWFFKAEVANLHNLPQKIKNETERLSKVEGVGEPRGSVIYAYLGESEDYESVCREAQKLLRSAAESLKMKAVPILIVFLYDTEGKLGQCLAELSILTSLSREDRVRFGNLIESHSAKIDSEIRELVGAMLMERKYVSMLNKKAERMRLHQMASEIFKQIYSSPITFPFDGYGNPTGNAAATCSMLTRELMHSTLDHSAIMAKPVHEKNRAIRVLNDAWGAISSNGKINIRPNNNILRNLTRKWDKELDERMLPLREMYDTLIKPPYGANQASAGLFLGVFIAPRSNKLSVLKNNQHMGIKQWADDNLIKYKQFNPLILEDAYLVLRTDDTSEWDVFLEEWEQAESHIARVECWERSGFMKEKIPLPQELFYREQRLSQWSKESINKIDEMEENKDQAMMMVKNNIDKGGVTQLSHGSSDLKALITKLESEKPLWLDEQIDDMKPVLIQGRQTIIQVFPDWLENLAPYSESPEDVGNFKHVMLSKVKKNLEDLNLDELAQELEAKVKSVIRNVEDIAEANRMVSDVNNWIISSKSIVGSKRLIEIRTAKDIARTHSNKLKGMYQRVKQDRIRDARRSLKQLYDALSVVEKQIVDRADKVWNSKLTDQSSINMLSDEIDSLIRAYDGLDDDLEDFHVIRKALSQFKRVMSRLGDETLSWNDFSKLANDVEQETQAQLSDNELPWLPEDVLKNIVDNVTDYRKQLSSQWTDSVLEQEEDIPNMDVTAANQLQNKLMAAPAYVTDDHLRKLTTLEETLEGRLSEIKIDWLVEKFKELSEKDRKRFLEIIR